MTEDVKVPVKERPILFSSPMVRAILDGRKTQTRRVVSAGNSTVLGYPGCQLWDRLNFDYDGRPDGYFTMVDGPNNTLFGCGPGVQYLHVPALEESNWQDFNPDDVLRYRVRPIWGVGERLWVRERWAHNYTGIKRLPPHYRADLPDNRGAALTENHAFGLMQWKPSIHMPRSLSRITLEITGVRVQRVQDISEADCKSEGTPRAFKEEYLEQAGSPMRASFATLWGSINDKRGYGWEKNPWVWVVEFRKLP